MADADFYRPVDRETEAYYQRMKRAIPPEEGASSTWGTSILGNLDTPVQKQPGLLSTIGNTVSEYSDEATNYIKGLLGSIESKKVSPGVVDNNIRDMEGQASIYRNTIPFPENVQKRIETKKVNPRTGKTTAGTITPTDLTGPSNEAYAEAMRSTAGITEGLMSDDRQYSVDQMRQFKNSENTVSSNVMQDVEKHMPEKKYRHAQKVLKGIISKETGGTFDYLQKQRTNNGIGPGRGLIQMENSTWQYDNWANSKPVFERRKDKWTKGMSLSDRIALVDEAEIVEGKETFNKGMNAFYKEWLDSKKYVNSSGKQMEFLIESLKNKTDYKIGNSAKVLKALNSGTNEDSAKTAMATFIKYVTRPKWSQGKSILELRRMKPFIETWRAGNKEVKGKK